MLYDVYKAESGFTELKLSSEPEEYEFEKIEEMVNFARHMYNLVHKKDFLSTRNKKRFEKVMIYEEIFESLTRLANSLSDLVKTKKQPNFNRLILFYRGMVLDDNDEYFKYVLKKLFDKWNDSDMNSKICIEIVEID
jgi:hypothetical protein